MQLIARKRKVCFSYAGLEDYYLSLQPHLRCVRVLFKIKSAFISNAPSWTSLTKEGEDESVALKFEKLLSKWLPLHPEVT